MKLLKKVWVLLKAHGTGLKEVVAYQNVEKIQNRRFSLDAVFKSPKSVGVFQGRCYSLLHPNFLYLLMHL